MAEVSRSRTITSHSSSACILRVMHSCCLPQSLYVLTRQSSCKLVHGCTTDALNSGVRGVSEIECSSMSFSLHLCYYVDVQNSGPISWKSSRQGGVTLSSRQARFVATRQDGREFLYLRALLRGFGCPQWELHRFGKVLLEL